MKTIQTLIRTADLYGTHFNFRIQDNYKFKTEIGGVLSIITLALFIASIFIFGDNFFHSLNPTTSFEKGIYKDDDVPLNNYTTTKPTDEKSYFIMVVRKSYLKMNKFVLKNMDSKGSIGVPLDSNPNNMTNEEIKNRTGNPNYDSNYLDILYFNIKDYNLGSNYKSLPNFGTISISSYSCFDKPEYFDKSLNCTKESIADYKLKNPSESIDIYIPRVGFDKNNYNTPLSLKYFSINYFVLADTLVYDNINMIQNVVSNDNGWFTQNLRNITNFGFYTRDPTSKTAISTRTVSKVSITILMSDEFYKYSRVYVKLQELLAEVLSIMKFVFSFFDMVNMFLRNYRLELFIANHYFTYEPPGDESELKYLKHDSGKEMKNMQDMKEMKEMKEMQDGKGKFI